MLIGVSSNERNLKRYYIVEHHNISYGKFCIKAAGGIGY